MIVSATPSLPTRSADALNDASVSTSLSSSASVDTCTTKSAARRSRKDCKQETAKRAIEAQSFEAGRFAFANLGGGTKKQPVADPEAHRLLQEIRVTLAARFAVGLI